MVISTQRGVLQEVFLASHLASTDN